MGATSLVNVTWPLASAAIAIRHETPKIALMWLPPAGNPLRLEVYAVSVKPWLCPADCPPGEKDMGVELFETMALLSGTIAITAGVLVSISFLPAQTPGASLEVLQLRPNFYVLAGAGGNVAFQIGTDGVIVVDTGSTSNADAV